MKAASKSAGPGRGTAVGNAPTLTSTTAECKVDPLSSHAWERTQRAEEFCRGVVGSSRGIARYSPAEGKTMSQGQLT